MAIGRRKMRGVVSNGMICSGRELGLSDDAEGILLLTGVPGATEGQPLTDALGIHPDVVFDVSVEANRPDAWSIAGVARDLAARWGLAFSVPDTAVLAGRVPGAGPPAPRVGVPVTSLATARVDDPELCPRLTVRVVTGVRPGPSPEWLARRLTLAGMRPINNVVDASNYVMLELGQPTHPYDLDRLTGQGLVVRRARPGETLVTLDGVERSLGRPGPGLGDTGQDCLICDARGVPVGIGGIMGGASSEIGPATTRVLLETAYFVPMAIARTATRLALRTEASARFERGCDPSGIDRAADRFCELLALSGGPDMTVAEGTIDVTGEVPVPLEVAVRPARINTLLGTDLGPDEIAELLAPLGMVATPLDGPEGPVLGVEVPTYRPDVRPAPAGEADIAEEVARIYGYARIVRRTPSWPQPGRLTSYQRSRRQLREILCGLGASEAWTATFVAGSDQSVAGFAPPYVEVTNPLVEAERFLRASMAPGLVRALLSNTERRQGGIRLFEVGTVFRRLPPTAPGGEEAASVERLSAVFAGEGDDAWTAVSAWRTVADGLRIADWVIEQPPRPTPPSGVLHRYRSATVAVAGGGPSDTGGASVELGVVGELDLALVADLGLVTTDGRPRRVGWLDLDLGVLFDPGLVPRRSERSQPVSRFPSSDIDLAFVTPESVAAGEVERTLREAGGELLESIELFDVYRGAPVDSDSRSLAFRLRFCAPDRTLTDREVAGLRQTCIDAVAVVHGAGLR
jgi:phenylalanyl-tRNA synthetase beta chain